MNCLSKFLVYFSIASFAFLLLIHLYLYFIYPGYKHLSKSHSFFRSQVRWHFLKGVFLDPTNQVAVLFFLLLYLVPRTTARSVHVVIEGLCIGAQDASSRSTGTRLYLSL